ncbi:hypothetical protein KR018_000294 [Drosophila ironensis]|nr:hypothetical protein KR018_000294 [Drosophila ironensis]
MYSGQDVKRSGVYRVGGNIADFQIELSLRHISEWLPVPRFEYNGARNPEGHDEHFPETEEDGWSDCVIHVPQDDDAHQLGYNCSYYSLGGPSFIPASTQIVRRRRRSLPAIEEPKQREEEADKTEETKQREAEQERQKQKAEEEKKRQDSQEKRSIFTDSGGGGNLFYERNRELCNGAVATIRINWQQKYFSYVELQRYLPDPGSCASRMQRRYHNWALEIHELQRKHLRKLEQRQKDLDPEAESDPEPQPLQYRTHRKSRKSRQHRRRSGVPDNAVATVSAVGGPGGPGGMSSAAMSDVSVPDDANFAARTCLIHTIVDGDYEDQWPPEARDLKAAGYQLMYIYADLQQTTLLVSMRYDPAKGLLYVYPDFCCSSRDLDHVVQIERDNDCRQLYAFGFENATSVELLRQLKEKGMEQDREREQRDLGGLRELEYLEEQESEQEEPLELPSNATAMELLEYYQHQRVLASEERSLLHFDVPPKRMRRVCLLLELQEAQFFENPNIHVRYHLHLPPHAMCDASATASYEDPLQGATATCRNAGDYRLANLGHCWQLTLLCEEQHHRDDLLHIYFEVISIDYWQRERSEGYAHYACSLIAPLPAEAVQLQCVRPVGSWLDSVKRYFIGGRQLFDFVTYFGDEDAGEIELHSRYDSNTRMATRGTGHLVLRLQKLQQRYIDTSPSTGQLQLDLSDSSDESFKTEDENASASSPVSDIVRATSFDEVMAAYKEARTRIEFLLENSLVRVEPN